MGRSAYMSKMTALMTMRESSRSEYNVEGARDVREPESFAQVLKFSDSILSFRFASLSSHRTLDKKLHIV